ncbi:MAG TPA: hypothetical protein VKI61_00065, partial [Chitinophagaceae bacterium]|nr:hypothetical protein [Chitinophagaceae bacterium]
GVVASSPELISDETHPDPLNGGINPLDYWVQIPIFMTAGGLDAAGDSDPPTMFKARDSITAHFINIFFGFYGNEGHDTWEKQWVVRDAYNNHILTNYWLQSHKAQPLVYGQNTKFCAGQPISLKLGLTPGYFAYEWQMNNGGGFTTVGTANTYIATQAGTYQVHFKRTSTSNWSDWTPNPVVITTTKCSADTAFAEHFDETPVVYVAATPAFQGTPYVYQNFICGNGLFPNHTEDFSTDGTGRMGGRFMLNNTLSGSQCTYVNTDQVYRTFNPPTVLPNTNYALSFSVANLVNYYANAPTAPPASLSASITSSNGSVINLTPAGGVRAMNTGNLSWKKYTYIWNSGNSNSAQIAITNNTTTTTWNDFALDEILLVKYKAPAMPGAAFANVALWSKGNSITAPDNSVVDAWNNDDVNGFSLKQATPDRQPIYKNNSADNINFNPVINFIAANNKNFSIDTGFSSNTVHNAVHAYMVAKFTNATTSRNVLF